MNSSGLLRKRNSKNCCSRPWSTPIARWGRIAYARRSPIATT